MKTISSLAFVTFLTGFASAATYSYTGSWDLAVSSSLNSGSTVDGTLIARNNSTVVLPFYDSSAHNGETLVGVQIHYTLPDTGHSASVTETITSTTGETFISTSFTATTTVGSTDLDALLFGYSSYVNEASKSESDLVVANGTPYTTTLTRTASLNRISPANTTAFAPYFNGTGTFAFQIVSDMAVNIVRTDAVDQATIGFNGMDSGKITVTYTTIPESSAALLGGLGVLTLLRRRRR
jgi:hypothetical protein